MVLHKIVKFALSKPRVINHRTVIVELVSWSYASEMMKSVEDGD